MTNSGSNAPPVDPVSLDAGLFARMQPFHVRLDSGLRLRDAGLAIRVLAGFVFVNNSRWRGRDGHAKQRLVNASRPA